jgi:SEC-C motif-containing protein
MTCPCFSKRDYAACCEPFHKGTPAPTSEQLMRSRYSAFSLGLAGYLRKTQLEELGPLPQGRRFTGLTIVEARKDEVLFIAGLEERGRDVSFAELSRFVKQHGEWKYADGITLPASQLPVVLTRETFQEAARCLS